MVRMSSGMQVFSPALSLDGRRHSDESVLSRNSSGAARPQMRSQNGVISLDGAVSEGVPIRRVRSLRVGSQADKQKRLSMNLDIKPNNYPNNSSTTKRTSIGTIDVSHYRGRGSAASTAATSPTKFYALTPHTENDDEADDEGYSREPVRRTSRTNDNLPDSLVRSNSLSFNSVAIRKTFTDGLQRVKSINSKKSLDEEDKVNSRSGDYVTYRGEDGDWQRHSIRRHSLQVEPCDYTFKIMLIGDSCVGKTCLMTRFKDGTFLSGTFISTVGMDFRNKVVTVDGSKVKLQIWDTAGQERFRSVTHAYYRDAHALLLLYDVTNKGSFDNTRAWLAEVHEYAQDDVVIMLIGNKGDVPERVLRREDGERLAREYNVAFMETSAKTGTNVDLAFMAVARELKARKSSNPDERKFNVAEYVRQEARTESCLCNIV